MDLSSAIKNSRLYFRLASDAELLNAVLSLREIVSSLAASTERTVPAFTDHTVRHMDALWAVADQVLSSEETDALTTAEVFLLTSGFYLHDIGMAYAATDAGLDQLKRSDPYRAFMTSVPADANSLMEASAVAYAVRVLHANAARELATSSIPGTEDQYLFESRKIREQWGPTCGEIAASHHWNIEQLDVRWGEKGMLPLPGGRNGNLLFVAALLRLIDYAHINRDRARTLDKIFRGSIKEDSLVHWLAQEHIDGPTRVDNELVYRAAKPQKDVDAWWLYYEMLSGLDEEIRGVKRILNRRSVGVAARLSLSGVRGASSPEDAALFVEPDGFLPIEINLRTGSIERLVELLAGETLYGPNPMAAVRELIQNARDAVLLKGEVAHDAVDVATQALPIRLSLTTTPDQSTLSVTDNGIGMTQKVMTDYLISVASSYWASQFANDFPQLAERGFKNAGKFGIGFLSVFMLGDEVKVESNRSGEPRFGLALHGVGRRGELRQLPHASGSGTSVRIELKHKSIEALTPFADLVMAYAPALPHPLLIEVNGEKTELPAGWMQRLSVGDFVKSVRRSVALLRQRRNQRLRREMTEGYYLTRGMRHSFSENVEGLWPLPTPEYRVNQSRLVASFEGVSLLCLRGLAVQQVSTPGFQGIIDLDSASPDVSRNSVIDADLSGMLEQARAAILPQIVENLNALNEGSLIIEKYAFLAECVSNYGENVLRNSSVSWISQLKLPGNVELISSSSLLSLLGGANSVFIAYGYGPWTALKNWVSDVGDVNQELAIVVDDAGQPNPPYRGSSEKAVGSLSELWRACDNAALFYMTVGLVAEAWQMNVEDLLSQGGWTHEGSHVHGRFSRH